jgi:hypothetical protein
VRVDAKCCRQAFVFARPKYFVTQQLPPYLETREAAQAQFNIGALYDGQENFPSAAKAYLKAEMLYDYDDISPRALYHAISAFLKAGERYARRVDIYRQKLETEYPDSPWTAKAKTLSASDVVAEP